MSKDDDVPLEELLKPLSAKVQPRWQSWGNISAGVAGDRQTEDEKAMKSMRSRLGWRNKKAKKKRA